MEKRIRLKRSMGSLCVGNTKHNTPLYFTLTDSSNIGLISFISLYCFHGFGDPSPFMAYCRTLQRWKTVLFELIFPP